MEHPIVIVNLIIQNYLMSWFMAGYIFRLSPGIKHLQFGLFGGLLVYATRSLVRLAGLPIGINTLITLILSIPIYKAIFKIKNWKEPSLISVLAYIMVLFIEILTSKFSLNLFHTTPDLVLSNPTLHFKLLALQNLWIFLFAILIIGINMLLGIRKEK